jgi:hypothetical protein
MGDFCLFLMECGYLVHPAASGVKKYKQNMAFYASQNLMMLVLTYMRGGV